jgi:hypothetical protein
MPFPADWDGDFAQPLPAAGDIRARIPLQTPIDLTPAMSNARRTKTKVANGRRAVTLPPNVEHRTALTVQAAMVINDAKSHA